MIYTFIKISPKLKESSVATGKLKESSVARMVVKKKVEVGVTRLGKI